MKKTMKLNPSVLSTHAYCAIVAIFLMNTGYLTEANVFAQLEKDTSKREKVPELSPDAHMEAHWAYHGIEGPEHWAMLSPHYLTCEAGSHQSPIDIKMDHVPTASEDFFFDYQPTRVKMVNNGHTIQVNVERGSTLDFKGRPLSCSSHLNTMSLTNSNPSIFIEGSHPMAGGAEQTPPSQSAGMKTQRHDHDVLMTPKLIGERLHLPVPPSSATSIQDPEPFPDPFADHSSQDYSDPWEPLNIQIFSFNWNVDKYVLKPAATGYNAVIPNPLQRGIDNAFHNLGIAPRLANNLLQTKFQSAGLEFSRFLINSTLGIVGLFDVAENYFEIEPPPDEDFGQTLAVYGTQSGPYLILPFLPPFTFRDAFGYAIDGVMSPHVWFLPITTLVGLNGGDIVNDRSLNLERFQGVEESTVDLYGAVRDAYLQKRAKSIQE